jgi:Histidine kinase
MDTKALPTSRSFYLPQQQDIMFWLIAFLIFYLDQAVLWGWNVNQGLGAALLNIVLGIVIGYPHLFCFDRFYGKQMGWYFVCLVLLGLFGTIAYWWIANIPISATEVFLQITPPNVKDVANLNGTWIGSIGQWLETWRTGRVGEVKNHTIWVRNFPEALIVMWSLAVLHRRKTLADLKQNLEQQNRWLELENQQLELTLANNRLLYDNFMRRMEPHFLFNIIGTLHTEAQGNPDLQEHIARIRDFMSYVVRNSREQEFMDGVTLPEEVEFLNKLIGFHDEKAQRQGLKPRISFIFRDNGIRPVKVPPMIFAEFVDNGFKYGVEQYGRTYRESLGRSVPLPVPFINVELRTEADATFFSVENSTADPASLVGGTGEGLPNIRARLRLFYGSRFRDDDLHIEATARLFRVALTLKNE